MSFNQLHVLQCDSWDVPETQPLVSKGCQNKVALFGHPTRALSNVILHCRLWLCVLSLSLACGLEGIELAFVCQMLLGQMGKVLPLQVHVCKPMFGYVWLGNGDHLRGKNCAYQCSARCNKNCPARYPLCTW